MTPTIRDDLGTDEAGRHRDRRRVVVTYAVGHASLPHGHEASTRAEIARRLVGLTGFEYVGEYDPSAAYAAPPYFVPSATLTSAAAARLGIASAQDLFGGVVPAPFVATKAITHSLVTGEARAPSGWSAEFPRRVAEVVLDGYSAFSREDALHAGRTLLDRGEVRVKLPTGIGGLGQWVAGDAAALERIIAAIDDDQIARAGIVVEENLSDVFTHSVGHLCIAGLTATYCGTQQLTTNNRGQEVYGGTRLCAARGDFDALLALDLAEDVRLAIAQARIYDEAARTCFPGLFASRRNYDVAQGVDTRGGRRSGVLEQSWRVGGASSAEIAALEAFRTDPSLRTVRAASREIYGEYPPVPEDSTVYYRGIDPHVGPMTKYALIEPYADTR
jgi:hypothetical protein